MNENVKNIAEDKLDIKSIRSEFPILNSEINHHPLIYFDNAATTQKPKQVINSLLRYYQEYNSNIHRGLHTLAEKATQGYEEVRKKVAAFINAGEPEEIIFTKGTTEGINLIAQTYARKNLKAGDEIILTGMEHHSNIVPWQMIAEEKGAAIRVVPVDSKGELDMDVFRSLVNTKTKIVSVVYASNSLGTINAADEIIRSAHDVGAIAILDGAQAAPHLELDVRKLNCDFIAFSAHKMYGPTGVGVLYGKRKYLESMPPYQGGGEMIKEVAFSGTTYNDIPHKFEAGTPNIADVIAFGEAVEFINSIGRGNIQKHENMLTVHAHENASTMKDLHIYGNAAKKVSVFSFLIEGIHPLDLGMMLDTKGIAVRTGHHCCQPLMDNYGIEGTVRASFAVYNTIEEIDAFFNSLNDITRKLKK